VIKVQPRERSSFSLSHAEGRERRVGASLSKPGGALGQNRTRRYARNPTESLHIGVLGKMLDSDYIAEGADGEIH
jgi:hypothetical protein